MVNNDSSLRITKKKLRFLNFFWGGFIIYTLSYVLSSTGHVNIKICQALQIPGLILMIISIGSIIQFKFDNAYLKFTYILYCCWLFSMILRDFRFFSDYSFLKGFLFNPGVGLLYFTPLLLLFPLNFFYLKKLFNIVSILGICYLIYTVAFIKDMMHNDTKGREIVENFSELSFASGFILLTYAYYSGKRQLLALGAVLLSLLFSTITARRGLIFMYAEILLFAYILITFYSKTKFVIIYVSILIGLVGTLYVTGVYKPRKSHLFGFLVDRGSEDTRTGVELYFYDDMKINDWIIGRGINGKYFCPNIEENQITNYRFTIETGYLQTILKGGLISLGLFLLIAIPAIILGLFYSKNILSKAAAIWIFMSLVNSYPSTVNSFSLQYLLVWVSIGICYSEKLRKMPESAVKNAFLNVKSNPS